MTSSSAVPLSVLDVSAFPTGGTPEGALRRTIAQARHAERLGYARYWLAEHHLNPGIAGSAPHVLLAVLAGVTERIRLGTAVTVLGNSTPLRVLEDLGIVATLHPGRVDLGIGRSGARPPGVGGSVGAGGSPAAGKVTSGGSPTAAGTATSAPAAAPPANRIVDGLVVPPSRGGAGALLSAPAVASRFALQGRLLGRTPGDGEGFEEDVQELLDLLDGTVATSEGVTVHAHPAEGSGIEPWIHGSSAGPSARLAGRLGLPFGANYHVAPSAVLEAVAEYRSSFRPGRIDAPHVIVSADVVVGETDAQARHLAAGYGQWVHSIRAGQGAIPYPSPEEAAAAPLTPAQQALVQDRLDTRFVGSPATVAAHLRTLQRVTGADELLLTTVTHDEQAQLRSFALLAEAWGL
ncbi:LLM class flavin-dependent oxidoreductase [Brachybacterium sp. NBEC-018]|uniref:LLM class flavin-dependent oxidoreductase n=1 Tax=Brachybacterium sp. NBEC-018 TaxID=2996004 RepID=UPI00217566E0|nr:LLM class flavin-dependent oxidoreductase [Brachybacterium sp. NBEC-018]UVY85048.1 LLM class flavin-dependent oxidoreductase [Brachybacterium sp. NBEC-018]